MSPLAALALKTGIPLVAQILAGKPANPLSGLAGNVLGAIAAHAGVASADLDALVVSDPGKLMTPLREVEAQLPEMVAVFLRETEGRLALLDAEQQQGGWASAWRPAGMYLIGFLWLWNVVILHSANAIWRIALPPMPFDTLIQISGLYMGLYMGGHTVKDLAEKWRPR